jgi:short-chain fatty acids transporter
MGQPKAAVDHGTTTETGLARVGIALANWSERWFPDPLVFALLGVVTVFLIGMAAGEDASTLAIQAGKNFWTLVPFTMQMVMVIVGGYVVASAPIMRRAIKKISTLPQSPRAAIAIVALFALLVSMISWGMSLIFSGLLVRELARRVKGMDYRAAGLAAYLGIGVAWALGLSSSAAMLMATKATMPPALFAISGVIPLTQTLFLWQSLATAAILITISVAICFFAAPTPENARTAEDFGVDLRDPPQELERRTRPGEWLEYSPLLTILVVSVLGFYIVQALRTSPQGALAALDLNTYNLMFITLGMLLHWRPKRFLRAVADCIPATGGVLLQFPFYAMIFGMIVGTGLSEKLAHLFARLSTHDTYPLLVAFYSAGLGVFIPSGGSKWIVEAPYVMQAAIANQVHLGWVVQIYNAAEALPNLINPFWMLPLLGLLKIRARDLVGYGILQLVIQAPVVFFLCWFFARTLGFEPPVK